MRIARNSATVADLPSIRQAIALLSGPRDEPKQAERETDENGRRWSHEWLAMSGAVRIATLRAVLAMLDPLIRAADARGEDYIAVPPWTLEPTRWGLIERLRELGS